MKLNARGMTLMEILIVMAIIAGLAATIFPAIQRSRDKGMVSETKVIMGQVINALNMYYTDCGKYPESLEGLTTADAGCANWGPEAYMKKIPADKWGTAFEYGVEGSSFVLRSLGSDRREGGDGNAKDISSEELQ